MQATSHPIQTRYDYDAILSLVTDKGKTMFGQQYSITSVDQPVITNLVTWFLRDKPAAVAAGIHLNKGLLLTGPIGCGKTAILRILTTLCKHKYSFPVKSCKEVAIAYTQEGYAGLEKYTGSSSRLHPPVLSTICFDDLGVENNVSWWGNECNVMAEVLLLRYEKYMSDGLLTHVTTNLNTQKLEERYGDRIRSRMRQMFNLVSFHPASTDKRI